MSKKPKRTFSAEFKAEAVKLVLEGGRTMNAVAQEVGVYPSVLRSWVLQAQADAGNSEALSSSEKEELAALRRENRQLKMEAEILKKATAFFARNTR